ncbi:MAG: DUF2220 family protein, partial [Clostridiales Family XIII bacterium]|nr:DUF2220 family protein [Clostridiales Family XIII bacterium]
MFVSIDELRRRLNRYYKRNIEEWILKDYNLEDKSNQYIFSIVTRLCNEKEYLQRVNSIQKWRENWENFVKKNDLNLKYITKIWPNMGKTHIPNQVDFGNIINILTFIDKKFEYNKLKERFYKLVHNFPILNTNFEVIYNEILNFNLYKDNDFELLINVLIYFKRNPQSNLYPRQLPIRGIHTKWIETRATSIKKIWQAITQVEEQDFYLCCGLKNPKIENNNIHLKFLDTNLRSQFSGLNGISCNYIDFCNLNLNVKNIFIVENKQVGLSFGELPNSMVIYGLGESLSLLKDAKWLNNASKLVYWGDIDTYGLHILAQARAFFPNIQSLLMDKETFLE